MILESLNGVYKDVDDLYGDQFTVALARAAATLECAPYWHSGEKAPSRLARAQELVRHSRVILQDERLAIVHGSSKAYDLNGFHCTCPQSQKGQSAWCVHAVAVKLARQMAAQAPREETLPIGPANIDERLAMGTIHDSTALQTHHTPQEDRAAFNDEDLEARDMETHHTPQEDRMPDDAYIPEPDTHDTTTAVLEPSDADFPPMGQPATRPLPGPVLLPSLDARTLEQSMQAWSEQRKVVRRFLQQELVEGTDYYTLVLGGRETKPTLSKAGSEKFLGLFQLQASFAPDLATWEMLGKPQDQLFYVCTLRTRSGEIVGEGRGARPLKKDGGDINKTLKMVEKSAQVDAILRTGALSDVFTQDLDDTPAEPVKVFQPSADLRKRIWAQVNRQAPQVKTQDAAEAWVQDKTGLAMEPDNYAAILAKLQGWARE